MNGKRPEEMGRSEEMEMSKSEARRPRRRHLGMSIVTGAAALSMLLAACSSSSTPTSSSSTTSSTAPKAATDSFAGKSITYLYFTNGPDLPATKTLIAKFDKQTGATVTLDTVPYADLNEQVEERLSAGNPPAVLQTSAPGLYGPELINLGKALGPAWLKSLNPNLMVGAEYDGKYIGLPNQLTVMGPIVNVTMFEKAHVPVPALGSKTTWAQFIADAEKVQAANHTDFAFAIDHSGDRVAQFFAAYGAFLFGNNGHGTMNAKAATTAMTIFTHLIEQNEISKAAWIAGGENYVAGSTEFLAGEAPVLLSGSWMLGSFSSGVPFKWTVVPNPCGPVNCGGGSGGNYMVAFKKSNDPALAEAFIKFMSEPANQAYMSIKSLTIPSSEALATPGSVAYPAWVDHDMEVFNDAATLMPGAFTLSESNPGYTAASLALMNEVTDVVAGRATVQEAVAATMAAAAANNGKS